MRNPKSIFRCLLAGVAFVAAMGFSEPVRAEVSVNINLGPPPIVVSAPPAVVMIPQSQVYFVPDPQIDVFFYAGTGGRARAAVVPCASVQRAVGDDRAATGTPAVVYMPRDYRTRYGQEKHVPYGQWKKDHSSWTGRTGSRTSNGRRSARRSGRRAKRATGRMTSTATRG